MSQDDNNNQEKKPGKFSFNSYWIYGSIILGLIVFNLMFLSEASTEVINFQRFAQLVEAGDVAKIEVVNKKDARVFLKEESLKKPEFKKLNETTFSKTRPQFVFNIGPPESFADQINELLATATIALDETQEEMRKSVIRDVGTQGDKSSERLEELVQGR